MATNRALAGHHKGQEGHAHRRWIRPA